jgi:acyl carrier protein
VFDIVAASMDLSRDVLLAHLQGHTRADLGKIDDDEALFSSGLVDSFAMVDLLLFLEKHTGARLGPEDVDVDNFDSIRRILAFAAARERS